MLVLVAMEVVPITAGEEFERVRYGTCIGGWLTKVSLILLKADGVNLL